MAQIFGTKAETLALLRARGFSVPPLLYFEVGQWQREPQTVLDIILRRFPNTLLAVRSSARCEDSAATSMAGAFLSILDVPSSRVPLKASLDNVMNKLPDQTDQALVQPMLSHVQISGVIMTRALDDGSPYYVFNYDDVSGRTDTVTGGNSASKVVYVYKGVSEEDFDSPRLREALRLTRALENVFGATPLDIEFAVDGTGKAWLLQVRPICATQKWKIRAAHGVSERIMHVETFIRIGTRPRPGFYGRRTMYGIMPDWNPAEMIGVVPRPLAFSLYREIITRHVWREARARMGYRVLPPADLMVSVAGRPYIDVRTSFNSFLPSDLSDVVAEKLINGWLNRLESHPELHDKVEFEIVPTVLAFDTESVLEQRYPGLLSAEEKKQYITQLRAVTNAALSSEGTLQWAMREIEKCRAAPLPALNVSPDELVLLLPALLENCRRGTLPFAMVARHAFMAEALLRSAVNCGALCQERLQVFKQATPTISGKLGMDFAAACTDKTLRSDFLAQYGHLRPGTYDILSPSYAQRGILFTKDVQEMPSTMQRPSFALTEEEHERIAELLHHAALTTTPDRLLEYARAAITGREYAKFVFTRHLSHMLELLAAWGASLKLSRSQVAMIPVENILETLFAPLPTDARTHFLDIIRRQQQLHAQASSFKLSQLIRSPRDVYIAPMHRAAPNFITSRRIEAPVVRLSAEDVQAEMRGKIVCIESADPGYDWIFTRKITGLITRFGGANSHMAIRCAEYDLPAAIGCGTLLFERVAEASACILDCGGKIVHPLGGNEEMLQ